MNRRAVNYDTGPLESRYMITQRNYTELEQKEEQKKHKVDINTTILEYASSVLQPLKGKNAAVIDTSVGNSTKACLEVGFSPHRIYSINTDASNLPDMGTNKIAMPFSGFLDILGRTKLDFVFYDGTSTIKNIYKDVYNLMEHLSNKAIVAFTISYRGSKDIDPASFSKPYALSKDCWFSYGEDETWNEYYLNQIVMCYASQQGYRIERVSVFEKAVVKKGIIVLVYELTRV